MNKEKGVFQGRCKKEFRSLFECCSDENVLDKESLFIRHFALIKNLSVRTPSAGFVRPRNA